MRLSVLSYKFAYATAKLKTLLIYRWMFKSIGTGSVVWTPYLLLNSEDVYIGNNVKIRTGMRMEVLKRPDNRTASIEIGDDVNIEQNVHIICQNKIKIGARVSITGNCAIVDTTHPYSEHKTGAGVIFNNDEVVIGDNVFVGFGTVILPGTEIGEGSYIGASSVVKGKFPSHSVIVGIPAKVIRSIQ